MTYNALAAWAFKMGLCPKPYFLFCHYHKKEAKKSSRE